MLGHQAPLEKVFASRRARRLHKILLRDECNATAANDEVQRGIRLRARNARLQRN